MLRKFVAIAAIAALAAVASAEITAYVTAPVTTTLTDGTPIFYQDFHVVVDAGDDWTVAGLHVDVGGDFIYQDPINDANPPNPGFFGPYPDSEYTSFYTSPGDWPNATYSGSVVSFATITETPRSLDTEWFDTISTGGGDFLIARLTQVGAPLGTTIAHFQYSSAETPGNVHDSEFMIATAVPEPAGLALLVLGGLVAARRRA